MQNEVLRLRKALEDLQNANANIEPTLQAEPASTTEPEAKIETIKGDVQSSDEESDEDEDIDLERDDQGNYIVFKNTARPEDGDGADEAEEEDDELSEKFLALRSTKQI